MILVIDYGMGNLRSVSKALEHLGGKVEIGSSGKEIRGAEKIVVPGVGAFGDAMAELEKLDLVDPLREAISEGKPFLGICLGLQLLFESSEESPGSRGLRVWNGKVQAFRSPDIKIPHMGWNDIHFEKRHPLLKGIPDGSFYYFVHTYYAVPAVDELVVGSCLYGEEPFAAMVGDQNVFATQFHPEKSQAAGLAILKNFISWKP